MSDDYEAKAREFLALAGTPGNIGVLRDMLREAHAAGRVGREREIVAWLRAGEDRDTMAGSLTQTIADAIKRGAGKP